MSKTAIALVLAACATASAASAETNLRPWDRQTVGLTPIGGSAPNRARTDTNDYGVRYTNGQPALGCRQNSMYVKSADGHEGQTAVYTCKW